MPTREQNFANEFDRDLYLLIRRAEYAGDEFGDHWKEVARLLRGCRRNVRARMSQDDLDGTEYYNGETK